MTDSKIANLGAPKMRANSVNTYQLIEGNHEWTFPGIGKVVVKPEAGSRPPIPFSITDNGLIAHGVGSRVEEA